MYLLLSYTANGAPDKARTQECPPSSVFPLELALVALAGIALSSFFVRCHWSGRESGGSSQLPRRRQFRLPSSLLRWSATKFRRRMRQVIR